ncbi:MAG: hypothetical protein AAGH38_00480 [Pseudomonadota bacterium]
MRDFLKLAVADSGQYCVYTDWSTMVPYEAFDTPEKAIEWIAAELGAKKPYDKPEQPEIPEGFQREGVELGDGSEPSSQMTLDEANVPRGADGNEIRVGDHWKTRGGAEVTITSWSSEGQQGIFDAGVHLAGFDEYGHADLGSYCDLVKLVWRAETAPDEQEDVSEGEEAEEAETGAGDAEADDGRAKEIEAEARQIYSRNIRELNGQVDPVDGQEFGVPDFRTPEEQAYRNAFTSNGTAGDPDQGKPRTVSANTAEVADPLDETGAL